jgi:uncharacterized membrane protein YccC
MIGPRTHAVIDYLIAASFLLGAGLFWSKSKRAALAALVCCGAESAVNLLTEYPGGVKKVIRYQTHGKIELGLAAMAATMPEFLAFDDEKEKTFFRAQGAIMTIASELTQYPKNQKSAERTSRRATA